MELNMQYIFVKLLTRTSQMAYSKIGLREQRVTYLRSKHLWTKKYFENQTFAATHEQKVLALYKMRRNQLF
jgi:hypothetical protein